MAHQSKAPDSDQDFEITPAGNHFARCCLVAYMGWHEHEFQGKKNLKPDMLFTFELCNTRNAEGKPFTISAFYTDSLHEKANMRRMLENWRGRAFSKEELRGFEINKVLDKPCLVSVVHKENKTKDIKARIQAVCGVPKGTVVPELINPPLYYTVEQDDPESCDILMLPEWIRKTLAKAVPAPGTPPDKGPPPDHTSDADDIPF